MLHTLAMSPPLRAAACFEPHDDDTQRLVHGCDWRRAVVAAAAATPLSSRQIMGGVEANMAGVNSSYLGPLRSLLYSAKLSHVTQTRLSGVIGGGGRKTYSTPTPSRSHSVH